MMIHEAPLAFLSSGGFLWNDHKMSSDILTFSSHYKPHSCSQYQFHISILLSKTGWWLRSGCDANVLGSISAPLPGLPVVSELSHLIDHGPVFQWWGFSLWDCSPWSMLVTSCLVKGLQKQWSVNCAKFPLSDLVVPVECFFCDDKSFNMHRNDPIHQ